MVVLKVVKRLLDAGVSLQNIRKAIDALRSRGVEDLAEITLISDGTTVYECRSPEEVVDLLQGGQGVFGIAIGGAFKEIKGLPGAPARRAGTGRAGRPRRRRRGHRRPRRRRTRRAARPPPSRVVSRQRLWYRARPVFFISLVLGALTLAVSVWWVDRGARGHTYQADDVPAAPVALVLGAQVLPDGTPSGFLVARLALAERLYEHGKAQVLLVSGDHSRPDYDEPDTMRAWLVAHGVPARKVVVDYAGFDTYDSCARANRVFGVRQRSWSPRPSISTVRSRCCRHLGIDATGSATTPCTASGFPWWRPPFASTARV